MAKPKKYKKETTIIIALVFITVLSALFIKRDAIFKNKTDMLQLPAINVPMQASDGSVHNLSANFYIDIPDNSKSIPLDKINSDISELLSKTNYDLLAEKDSLTSVMNSIQEQIKSKYPDITINHVYVSNFLTDFKLSESTKSTNSKNDILNGLQFKK
jgi:flagellar basal body-associated protein FliL